MTTETNTTRRQNTLSPALIADIKRIQAALADVYPLDLQDWIDRFLGDAHPDREIKWWVGFAQKFTDQADGHPLEKRKKIFTKMVSQALLITFMTLRDGPHC